MLYRKDERRYQIIEHMKGGEGEFQLLHIAEAENMGNKATLFARGVLPVGASVGLHRHEGNMEICCFVSGRALVKEDECKYEVSPGDISICRDGESHSVINTGDEELVYMVLVLKTL